jgi:hypothetical protein
VTNLDASLCCLLRDDLFAGESMSYRRWLASCPDLYDVLSDLPGENASLAELISVSLQVLRNRGRIDKKFFENLLRARPRKRAAIVALMRDYLPDGTPAPAAIELFTVVPTTAEVGPEITTDIISEKTEVMIGSTKSSQSLTFRLLRLTVGSTVEWLLGKPFSPAVTLIFSQRASMRVDTPNYFYHAGMRKAQTVFLDSGPAEITVVQSQPSIRRATIIIHRGILGLGTRRFDLAEYSFAISSALPGRIFTITAPDVSARPVILWIQDTP